MYVLANNLTAILQVVEAGNAQTETRELTELVRHALRESMPGTGGWRRLIILSPELEDEIARAIQTQDGKRFLALPAAKLDDLRSSVRDGLPVEAAEWRLAIAVLTPGLRPFVRALVALDHPNLPVVAFTELPDGRRLVSERLTGAPTLTPL